MLITAFMAVIRESKQDKQQTANMTCRTHACMHASHIPYR